MIPYAVGGKAKILRMQPYNAITLALPGRHASDTTPVGGDFVVMVDDDELNWTSHQFTHTDIFNDIEYKYKEARELADVLVADYYRVILGDDPETIEWERSDLPGIHPKTFLYAVQCLGVAEHRRYAKFENKFGGRFLPLRFATGITEGLWAAVDAIEKQRMGRPGVEWLEKEKGIPTITKELMS